MHEKSEQALFSIATVAFDLPVAEQEPFVESKCGDNTELTKEVLALLRHADRADEDKFLTVPGKPLFSISRDQWLHQISGSASTKFSDITAAELIRRLHESGLRIPKDFKIEPEEPAVEVAKRLVRRGKLTPYQAQVILEDTGEQLVLGNYVLLESIGAGGMGLVFKALHRKMNCIRAVKLVSKNLLTSENARRRFQREVMVAAHFDHHPNVVMAHDATEDGGTLLLAMEYVAGTNLHQMIQRVGPLPIRQALGYLIQAARGLEHIHSHRVVHRDVKPLNMLIAHDDTLKLADMGLARIASDIAETEQLTQPGDLLGSFDYAAPEQGVPNLKVDQRADIYALGCTLHYMLTVRPPFGGDTAVSKIMAHQESPIPSLRRACAKLFHQPNPRSCALLDALFRAMLAKRPEDRVGSMRVVIDRAEKILDTLATADGKLPETPQPAPPKTKASETRIEIHPQIASVSQRAASLNRASDVRYRAVAIGVGIVALLGLALIFNPFGWNNNARDNGELGPTEALDTGKTSAEMIVRQPDILPRSGRPMSKSAFVTQPAAIPGVLSWTIVPRAPLFLENYVRFSPDGKLLALAGWDAVIRIKNASTGHLVSALVGHNDQVRCVDWSPDGSVLASCSEDGSIRLWSVESRSTLRILRGHTAGVCGVSWLDDGTTLVSVGMDKTLRLWDVATGQQIDSRETELDSGYQIVDSSHQHIAISDTSGRRMIWDAPSLQPIIDLSAEFGQHTIKWSPDGSRIAHSSARQVVIVDTRSWQQQAAIDATGAFAWSPDGRLIVAGGSVWDSETGESLRPVEQMPNALAWVDWCADGQTIAAEQEGVVYLFDLEKPGATRVYRPNPTQAASVKSNVAWSNNGRHCSVVAMQLGAKVPLYTCPVYTWDLANRSMGQLHHLPYRTPWPAHPWTLNVSPKNDYIVACDQGHEILVYFINSDEGTVRLTGHTNRINKIALSPDGHTLVSCSDDGTARSWEVKSGTELDVLEHTSPVKCVTYSPDGKLISTVDNAGVHFWSSSSGERRSTLESEGADLIAFSETGKTIAIADIAGNIQLWDVEEEIRFDTIETQSPPPLALTFSGESTVLTCDGTNGVRFWETVPATSLTRRLELPGGKICSAEFSSDQSRLAITSDNVTRIIDLQTFQTSTHVALRDGQFLIIDEDGHYIGSPRHERHLVYVAQGESGQETLTPGEFSAKYGWQNDPDAVRLTSATGDQHTSGVVRPSEQVDAPSATIGLNSPNATVGPTLVVQPAKLDGVESWSMETVVPRGNSHDHFFQAAPCISNDGSEVAVLAQDGAVRFYDLQTGRLQNTWHGMRTQGWGLDWAADRQFSAAVGHSGQGGGGNDMLFVWDTNGRLLESIESNPAYSVAWCSTRPLLALGAKSLSFWEPGEGLKMKVDSPNGINIMQLEWSPDGKQLAVAGSDNRYVWLWDASSESVVHVFSDETITADSRGVVGLAWSPDGSTLASRHARGGIRTWDIGSKTILQSITTDESVGLAWSADSRWVAFCEGTNDCNISLVDAKTGERSDRSISLNAISPGARLDWSHDGHTLVALLEGGGLRVFDMPSGTLRFANDEVKTQMLSWINEGEMLIDIPSTDDDSGDEYDSDWANRRFLAWDTNLGAQWRSAGDLPISPRSGVPSPDGRFVATLHRDEVLVLQDGRLARRKDRHSRVARHLAWSPDSNYLAIADRDMIELWDIIRDQVIGHIDSPDAGPTTTTWLHDNLIAVTDDQGEVYLHDRNGALTLQVTHTVSDTPQPAHHVAQSPDGKYFATAGGTWYRGSINIWDGRTGELHRVELSNGSPVVGLRWAADKVLSAVDSESTFRQWRVDGDLLPIRSLRACVGGADTAAHFSTSGQTVAIGRGATRWLYDVETATCLGTIVGIPGGHLMQVSPNGHYMASSDIRKTIVYCVELDSGARLTLTQGDFEARFGWKNDPEKARIRR